VQRLREREPKATAGLRTETKAELRTEPKAELRTEPKAEPAA
jgi:hypothetical protein